MTEHLKHLRAVLQIIFRTTEGSFEDGYKIYVTGHEMDVLLEIAEEVLKCEDDEQARINNRTKQSKPKL